MCSGLELYCKTTSVLQQGVAGKVYCNRGVYCNRLKAVSLGEGHDTVGCIVTGAEVWLRKAVSRYKICIVTEAA